MKFPEAIATLSGVGRVPVAPGTAASVVALILAWPMYLWGGRVSILIAGLAAAGLGIWASDRYVRDTGRTDPSECVIDELAGQWIACAFVPFSAAGFIVVFLLFRFFDMIKPWPISALERLPGGYGIMADDLGAGIVAGLLVAAFARAGLV